MRSLIPLSSLLALSSLPVSTIAGLRVPLTRRSATHLPSVRISSSSSASGDDPFGFQSIDGIAYTGIIGVNGDSYTVHIDTGSSDLWLDTQGRKLTGMTNTGSSARIGYV